MNIKIREKIDRTYSPFHKYPRDAVAVINLLVKDGHSSLPLLLSLLLTQLPLSNLVKDGDISFIDIMLIFCHAYIFHIYIYFTCIYIYFCMLHKCSKQYRKNQFKCPVPWTHEELILRCCKNHNEKLNYTNDESLSIWNEQLKIRTMLGALMLCFESQANFRSLEQIEDTAYADMHF